MKKLILGLCFLVCGFVCEGQNQKIDSLKPAEDTTIYEITAIQKPAQFPSGEKGLNDYIVANIYWPGCCTEEKLKGIHGKVYLKLVIEKDGSIIYAEAIKYPPGGEKLADEALFVVKQMPMWTSAMKGGKYVRMYYTLTVNFKSGDIELDRHKATSAKTTPVIPDNDTTIYEITAVDKQAQFPLGYEGLELFIERNLNWPNCCLYDFTSGVSGGDVYVKFVVEKDGSVSNIEVVKYPPNGEQLAKEVVRLMKQMPKWTPAMLGGNDVRMCFTIPVNFKTLEFPKKGK